MYSILSLLSVLFIQNTLKLNAVRVILASHRWCFKLRHSKEFTELYPIRQWVVNEHPPLTTLNLLQFNFDLSGYQRINLNVLCENKFASSTVGTPSSPAPFNILNNRNFCFFCDSKRVASFTFVEFHCLMQNLVALNLNLTFLSLANFRMKMKIIRREWQAIWKNWHHWRLNICLSMWMWTFGWSRF